jgi:hypothetical protein
MGDATKVDMDAWDRDLRINLTSMVLTARHAIPHMRKNGRGAIVNMSSVSGLLGGNPSLLYPTTKGAIIQMTRAMAAQHGQENIRVNCVAPGMVFTPMVKSRGVTDEMRQARIAQNLMKQEGDGWDVGYAVLFLCSREAKWITGLIMPVDGGVSAMLLTFVLRSITDNNRPPQAKQTDQRSRPITLRHKIQAYLMASYKFVGLLFARVSTVCYIPKAERSRPDEMKIDVHCCCYIEFTAMCNDVPFFSLTIAASTLPACLASCTSLLIFSSSVGYACLYIDHKGRWKRSSIDSIDLPFISGRQK